jgi:2-dehydro-3-deoxyphosphogluconate aldolase / (4S)-4-hydroxy-2-oxoglutarate aldolase
MLSSDVLGRVVAHRFVPVAEVDDDEQAVDLAGALARGGLPVVEITLRTSAGLAAIGAVAEQCPGVLVGAGTVLTLEQAEAAIDAGASFVVSPGIDRDLVALCERRGILAIPGVCTPTDLQLAVRLGLTTVKFFPAEQMGGAATLKALSAPFRDLQFVPTGGVTMANAPSYFELPCVVACGSSYLADKALLRAGELDEIERRARAARELVGAAS